MAAKIQILTFLDLSLLSDNKKHFSSSKIEVPVTTYYKSKDL